MRGRRRCMCAGVQEGEIGLMRVGGRGRGCTLPFAQKGDVGGEGLLACLEGGLGPGGEGEAGTGAGGGCEPVWVGVFGMGKGKSSFMRQYKKTTTLFEA